MKKFILFIVLMTCGLASFADHIKGGWIYYEYLGKGVTDPNANRYRITVKVYRDCSQADPNHPQNSSTAAITVYTGTSSTIYLNLSAPRTAFYLLQKGTPNPCMSNPPVVCYRILQYEIVVELPPNAQGYTLSYQRCCRISGIQNLQSPSNQWGNTYTATIPGTTTNSSFPENSSPKFVERDTAVICFNSPFTLDYGATDTDAADSLVYSICGALHGGSNNGTGGAAPDPASPPPYSIVGYQSPYSATNPFAANMTINSKTGLITGTAPATPGEYVISVCVNEFRQGTLLGITRKELHVIVGNCSLSGAQLQPNYITCDGFTLSFQNELASSNIAKYTWNFGDPGSGVKNTDTVPKPTHTYSDSGIYVLKLNVVSTGGCLDSATALVKVFPGFIPNFQVVGTCFQTPIQFNDQTTTVYGFVDSWRWNFGDLATTADTSRLQNPNYKYPTAQNPTVQLIVTNSKGCVDTISKNIVVNDIPSLVLPFKDTLICSIDTLQLRAIGNGNFSWTPTTNMINPNSPNPLVFPKDTASYVVTLNENGCIKKDTIKVNVLQFITVDAGKDTSMCRTDTIILNPVSHALQYVWSPATYLNNSTSKHPISKPDTTITYTVTANLGKCQDKDSVTIFVTPYPQAKAGNPVTICYGDRTQLQGSIVGSSFNWSPTNSLLNSNTLTPIAGPMFSTNYVLTAYDTIGCPKPFRDTVRVTVIPQVIANAGRDTTVVANQPLQLFATGGASYLWSPTTGMNDPNIANPIVILGISVDSIIYRVRVTVPPGCFADDDVKVKVYKTGPEIFVPSGFTPNADGRNDILRPIVVGVKSLTYFRVFNRWGQQVYSTSSIGQGWDGRIAGKDQGSGTFVYMAEAIDYLGNRLFRKGTVVLIR